MVTSKKEYSLCNVGSAHQHGLLVIVLVRCEALSDLITWKRSIVVLNKDATVIVFKKVKEIYQWATWDVQKLCRAKDSLDSLSMFFVLTNCGSFYRERMERWEQRRFLGNGDWSVTIRKGTDVFWARVLNVVLIRCCIRLVKCKAQLNWYNSDF